MAETLIIAQGNKEEKYHTLLPQIKSLTADEPDIIANLGNTAAAIYDTFRHLWVGFYRVRPALRPTETCPEELVLGPFQGPIACTRIRKGHGVCGTAWEKRQTLIVPDVARFSGHIACSSRSRSEIVVPIRDVSHDCIWGLLDIDSENLGTFDDIDTHYLEEICALLAEFPSH